MDRLPGALIVIDVHRERNAVREAKKLGIPTICLIDTDSDPDYADVPIPGNDDAIRAIEMVLTHLTEAVEVGKKGRTEPSPEEAEAKFGRRSRRPAMGQAGEGSPEAVAAAELGGRVDTGTSEVETPTVSGPAADDDSGLTPATIRDPDVDA